MNYFLIPGIDLPNIFILFIFFIMPRICSNCFMKLLAKIKPVLILRLGLGLMYLYSGYDLFQYPKSWSQFVPSWLKDILATGGIDLLTFLKIQGLGEILMAAVFVLELPNKIWR